METCKKVACKMLVKLTVGFMSTGNDDLPANLGLWDQNLALKWVQSHIKDLGGDPKKVFFF